MWPLIRSSQCYGLSRDGDTERNVTYSCNIRSSPWNSAPSNRKASWARSLFLKADAYSFPHETASVVNDLGAVYEKSLLLGDEGTNHLRWKV
jgi:hypothetical protein